MRARVFLLLHITINGTGRRTIRESDRSSSSRATLASWPHGPGIAERREALPKAALTRERNPLARPLWFANFLLRTFVLAKLAPRIFAPAAIVLVQRPHLSYQAVWQTAQQTTRRLQAIATCVLAAVAWPWLRRALLGA
jgi:hypothetical protein